MRRSYPVSPHSTVPHAPPSAGVCSDTAGYPPPLERRARLCRSGRQISPIPPWYERSGALTGHRHVDRRSIRVHACPIPVHKAPLAYNDSQLAICEVVHRTPSGARRIVATSLSRKGSLDVHVIARMHATLGGTQIGAAPPADRAGDDQRSGTHERPRSSRGEHASKRCSRNIRPFPCGGTTATGDRGSFRVPGLTRVADPDMIDSNGLRTLL